MIQKILSLSYPRIVTLEYRLRQGIATLEWLPSLLPVGDSSADHHPRLRRLHVDESQLTILLQGTVAVQIAPCLNEATTLRVGYAPCQGKALWLERLAVTYLFGEKEWERDCSTFAQTGNFPAAGIYALRVQLLSQPLAPSPRTNPAAPAKTQPE